MSKYPSFHVLGFNGLGLSIKYGGAFLFLILSMPSFCQISSSNLKLSDYKAFLQGRFNPDSSSFFIKIPLIYTQKDGVFLQKETLIAFKKMYIAAKEQGINLTIISGTRNFSYQKGIWEKKWNSKKFSSFIPGKSRAQAIMKYSAMPGASRHHWGTDIDLNSLNNVDFVSGSSKKVYDWLLKNAGSFGFCQVYSTKNDMRKTGYEEEKWHWSYIPLAKRYTTDYKIYFSNSEMVGFSGAESFKALDVLNTYVLGINPSCK